MCQTTFNRAQDIETRVLCEALAPQLKGIMKGVGEYSIQKKRYFEFLFSMYEQFVSHKDHPGRLIAVLPLEAWLKIEAWAINNNLENKVSECYKNPAIPFNTDKNRKYA